MNILSFNNDYADNNFFDRDILSVFRQQPEKTLTIQQGMSVKEISDVVSDKIIAVVQAQFQATKEQFQAKEKNIL